MRASVLIAFLALFCCRLTAQEISPYLFGQNHWLAQGDEGTRPGYLALLWPRVEASGVRMIRIGGNGYERHMPDSLRLSKMIDSIKSIGAEPLLQVPRQYSADEAYRLVRSVNTPANERVKYWSIGNEPILSKDTIEQINTYILKIAPAMKKADPSIKILVFDECDFYPNAYRALCGGRLDLTGKDNNGNWIIDGFTFHRYPNGAEYERTDVVFGGIQNIHQSAMQLADLIRSAEKKHGRRGDASLIWGLTEVNVTYANPNREVSGTGNPSFLGGQFIAEAYGIGLKFGAFTVCPWCISETDHVSTDFGYLGLPSEFFPRSSYYHTQMMALNFKGHYLPVSTNNKYVKAIGSQDRDRICVMILNEAQTGVLDFALVLNARGKSVRPLVVKTDAGIDEVISGRIPNQTTVLFVLDGKGKKVKEYTYGLAQNLRDRPPEVRTFQ